MSSALWTLALIVISGLLTWRGVDAIRNKVMRGRRGVAYEGQQAVLLGWVFAILGPTIAVTAIVGLIQG